MQFYLKRTRCFHFPTIFELLFVLADLHDDLWKPEHRHRFEGQVGRETGRHYQHPTHEAVHPEEQGYYFFIADNHASNCKPELQPNL